MQQTSIYSCAYLKMNRSDELNSTQIRKLTQPQLTCTFLSIISPLETSSIKISGRQCGPSTRNVLFPQVPGLISYLASFRISLRWPIHIIIPVDETKLSCNTPHRRSTTIQFLQKLTPFIHLQSVLPFLSEEWLTSLVRLAAVTWNKRRDCLFGCKMRLPGCAYINENFDNGNQKATSECAVSFKQKSPTIILLCSCLVPHCCRSEEPTYPNTKQILTLRCVLHLRENTQRELRKVKQINV